jgi:Mn2+/Fe2+ NRAMP family transporter
VQKKKKAYLAKATKYSSKLKLFWESAGPGIVAGAADDDPSGIGTYTQAGAQFGTIFLWTAVF